MGWLAELALDGTWDFVSKLLKKAISLELRSFEDAEATWPEQSLSWAAGGLNRLAEAEEAGSGAREAGSADLGACEFPNKELKREDPPWSVLKEICPSHTSISLGCLGVVFGSRESELSASTFSGC